MKTYIVGPSVVRLTGHTTSSAPGSRLEHDFGPDGPDGVHGAAREAALLACGALVVAEATSRPVAAEPKIVEPPAARRSAVGREQ